MELESGRRKGRGRRRVYNEIQVHAEDGRDHISITWRGTCTLERAVQEVKELMNEIVRIRMR